jgi:MFS family permease
MEGDEQQSGTDEEPLALRGAPSAHQVAAIVAGNALEFYDFLAYSFFAVQIGKTFFPSHSPGASLLASLATFGAGFLTRPIGALVIGRLGDRAGRKPAMLLSFGLMGIAITGLALTPSFRAIGVAAPIAAIAFRLVQGFALGGEVGPSTAFLFEAAPPLRRGLYVSFQFVGQNLAVLCAGLIGVALSHILSPPALTDWGWRIAFLLGAGIVPFGLLLRRDLDETLNQDEPALAPPAMGDPAHARQYLAAGTLGLIMLAAGTIATYVLHYLTTYATATLNMASEVAFGATVANGLMGAVFAPIGGWLSDRYGRRATMIAPWLALLALVFPCFYAISRFQTPLALFAATAAMSVAASISSSSVLTAITESLPKSGRSGALALIYAVAISIFGGTAQFAAAWMTQATHNAMAPAWYMAAAVTLGLGAMLALPETAPIKALSNK